MGACMCVCICFWVHLSCRRVARRASNGTLHPTWCPTVPTPEGCLSRHRNKANEPRSHRVTESPADPLGHSHTHHTHHAVDTDMSKNGEAACQVQSLSPACNGLLTPVILIRDWQHGAPHSKLCVAPLLLRLDLLG